MNIKITHKWLLEYLDTKATPEQIENYLCLCGPSVERVEKIGDDYVYEIEITSNRIDTASVIGIAREAYAILNRFGIKADYRPYKNSNIEGKRHACSLKILDDNHLVKRVVAVVMDGIRIAQSPQFIKDRLEAVGIRSLNNIIDITNYVMVELGHPTHVMDYDRIKTGKLIFRLASQGEALRTLDGKEYKLNDKDVVVDDGTGRIVDLPGIMGTENSVVTDTTKQAIIFIESNYSNVIRQTSMRTGIRTVAATYNEKSVDPELTPLALRRVIQLFEQYAQARVASQPIDLYHEPVKPKKVSIAITDVEKIIGVKIAKKEIVDILLNLEFILESDTNDVLTFQVPSYRSHEVGIKEDLVEEVARVYGYFNLPNNLQPMAYVSQPKDLENLFNYESKIKYFLKHLGLHEVVNYSMISEEMIKNNRLTGEPHLRLKNTISAEIEYLRRHLSPSLIKNIQDNTGKEEVLRFFEIGKTYKPRDGELPIEEYKLGLATNTSYEDLKGIVDALLKELNITDYKVGPDRYQLFPHKSIYIVVFDLMTLIEKAKPVADYKGINPYAVVKLDLTIDLGGNTPPLHYETIRQTAFKTSKLLTNIEFINRFENKISLRLYFSASDRNITEKEAKTELDKIKNAIAPA